MMMMIRNRSLLAASALLVCLSVSAQVHRMDIDLKKVGAPIQPTMYGSSRTSTTRPTAACTPSS